MEELKLTFVNVGYGEAALLECPDPAFPGGTFVMVIDGGSAEAEEYRDSATGRIPLDQYLSLRGVDHIDLMAATHVHEDHLCGLLPAAEKLPPAALWQTLPPEFCRSMRTLDIPAEGLTPSRSKFLRALNDYRRLCLGQSCPRHRPLAGMELRLCRDLLVRVLGPSRAQAEKLASSCRALYEEADPSAFWQRLDQLDVAMNNYSLILLLEYRGTRILLPGDTNYMGYGGLDPASLRADLFKVGHHGQRDGISAEQIQAIAPRAVRRLLEMMGDGSTNCSAAHLKAVVELARGDDPSAVVFLPGGRLAQRVYRELLLTTQSDPLPPFLPTPLALDGETEVGGTPWRVRCRPVRCPDESGRKPGALYLARGALEGPLVLRPRQTGDAVSLPGRGGTKTLKKLFIDEKVPRRERERIPVLADGRGVAAVAGFGPEQSRTAAPGQAAYELIFWKKE